MKLFYAFTILTLCTTLGVGLYLTLSHQLELLQAPPLSTPGNR